MKAASARSAIDPQIHAKVCADNDQLREERDALKRQLDWFKRQVFGSKSEKRLDVDPAIQADLLAELGVDKPPPPKNTEQETVGQFHSPISLFPCRNHLPFRRPELLSINTYSWI